MKLPCIVLNFIINELVERQPFFILINMKRNYIVKIENLGDTFERDSSSCCIVSLYVQNMSNKVQICHVVKMHS